MLRTHSLIAAALAALCLLAGCGAVAPAVFSAPQAPIARAFTPTPALAVGGQPAPQRQAATPMAIVVQAAPVAAPVVVAAPQQLDQLGHSIDSYMNDIVSAGWFQGAVLVARNGK